MSGMGTSGIGIRRVEPLPKRGHSCKSFTITRTSTRVEIPYNDDENLRRPKLSLVWEFLAYFWTCFLDLILLLDLMPKVLYVTRQNDL